MRINYTIQNQHGEPIKSGWRPIEWWHRNEHQVSIIQRIDLPHESPITGARLEMVGGGQTPILQLLPDPLPPENENEGQDLGSHYKEPLHGAGEAVIELAEPHDGPAWLRLFVYHNGCGMVGFSLGRLWLTVEVPDED